MTAVALILTATQAESEEVSDQTVKRLTDQGSFDLAAILTVDKGRIENVALEQTIAPRNPSKADYTCRANVANGVPNSHWETRGVTRQSSSLHPMKRVSPLPWRSSKSREAMS